MGSSPKSSAHEVIVVGGGIAGMTAASRLLDLGYDVTLLEAASSLGGLTASWNVGGITWDTFYHVVLESDVRTRAMLHDLGLEKELIWNVARSGLYADGSLHAFSTAIDLLRFPGLSLSDKFRFGRTILHAAKVQTEVHDPYDGISAIDYLLEHSGPHVTEKWWRPLLRAKLGDRYELASASFIRATIARLFGARKSKNGSERFGYIPGGYKRILERYEQVLESRGVDVRTGVRVSRVIEADEVVTVETDCGALVASRAILTVPSAIATKIFPQTDSQLQDALLADRYMGVLCLSVVTKKSLGPYYLTNIADTSIPFTGVINMSALVTNEDVRAAAFEGNALCYIPAYVPSDDPLFDKQDEEILSSFLPHLHRIYPCVEANDILAVRIARARHVFPYPDKGRSERVRAMDPAHYTERRIAIVNAARLMHAVLNVNDTIGTIEEGIAALQLGKKERYEATRRAIA